MINRNPTRALQKRSAFEFSPIYSLLVGDVNSQIGRHVRACSNISLIRCALHHSTPAKCETLTVYYYHIGKSKIASDESDGQNDVIECVTHTVQSSGIVMIGLWAFNTLLQYLIGLINIRLVWFSGFSIFTCRRSDGNFLSLRKI